MKPVPIVVAALATLLLATAGAALARPPLAAARDCPMRRAPQQPVAAPILRSFGYGLAPLGGRAVLHAALVYRTVPGAIVRAAQGGRVVARRRTPRGGFVLWVEHGNGTELRYGVLGRPRVHLGACIAAGAVLGRARTSSLSLALRRDGHWIDPGRWLAGEP